MSIYRVQYYYGAGHPFGVRESVPMGKTDYCIPPSLYHHSLLSPTSPSPSSLLINDSNRGQVTWEARRCRDFMKTGDRPLERRVTEEEGSRNCASKLMARQNSKAGSPFGHGGMRWETGPNRGRVPGRRGHLTRAGTLKLPCSCSHIAQFSCNLRGDQRSSSHTKVLLCAETMAEGWDTELSLTWFLSSRNSQRGDSERHKTNWDGQGFFGVGTAGRGMGEEFVVAQVEKKRDHGNFPEEVSLELSLERHMSIP